MHLPSDENVYVEFCLLFCCCCCCCCSCCCWWWWWWWWYTHYLLHQVDWLPLWIFHGARLSTSTWAWHQSIEPVLNLLGYFLLAATNASLQETQSYKKECCCVPGDDADDDTSSACQKQYRTVRIQEKKVDDDSNFSAIVPSYLPFPWSKEKNYPSRKPIASWAAPLAG